MAPKSNSAARLVASLCGLTMASHAAAQTASVGTATATTREEIQRAQLPAESAPQSRLTVDSNQIKAPCPLTSSRFANNSFQFKGAVFDHLRGLTSAEFRPVFADLVGKEISVGTLCGVRDAATAILKRAGYVAALEIPEQYIDQGIVHFNVIMAKLVGVRLKGNAGRSGPLVAAYLNKLVNGEPFNSVQAERYLLLAYDLPGLDVRMTLVPAGSEAGDVIGEVSVASTPIAVDTNIQNYGSHYVGRWGLLVRGEAYGLLGLGDRASIGFYSTAQTHEQNVLQVGYDARLGDEGLTLGGHYTHAWTHPSLGTSVDVRSTASVATLSLSYPLLRQQAQTIRLSGGVDLIDEKVEYGPFLLTEDRNRMLFVQLNFDGMDRASIEGSNGFSSSIPRWRTSASLQIRKGLPILGAHSLCGFFSCATTSLGLSHIEANSTATIARFEAETEYRPTPAVSFVLAPRGQYSGSRLVNYEQFAGGSFTVGRGYDPGAILGDKGVGFSAEVRAGKLVRQHSDRLSLQPYLFVDKALAWNNGRADLAFQGTQSLLSAGGGVRAEYRGHVRLDLTVANPIEHVGLVYAKESTRILMSLTTRLWPW